MKKLIVNADDYGLTFGVCDGIIKACRDGIVRSTTVMINMPDIEKKLDMIKKCANIGMGVHLNVTCGKSVENPKEVASLLDEEGNFWRKPDLVIQKGNLGEVEKEWTAQIEKCKKLGIKITHLDTHHHAHAKKELTEIYFNLAKKYNLPARVNNMEMAQRFKAGGVRTPDYFIEEFYADRVNVENFIEIIKNLKEGVTEICSHPGVVDEELRVISSYKDYRTNELAVYTNPDIKNLIEKENISLIGFANL